ncbi:holin [Bacillus phage BCASJ1c]|uniref:Holin n=1 Tax=Bacillus phage BCASJ1c TaxID=294382 RepID=Q5YA53_9CAUD|nr:holin [Bacillus phage BCASJ1c]AAU85104.1 holin [Bacillus phage BCASJ1c]
MDFTTEFAPYVGLAVILYAIRQTGAIPNAYIPITAILLGVPFSFWEHGGVSPEALVTGLQYALLGVGTVAGIKYFLETKKERKDDRL